MTLRRFLCVLCLTAALPLSAQTLDVQFSCSQSKQEDGDGERLIFADQGRMRLDGGQVLAFQWESTLFRTSHGYECSIDEADGVQAEVTEKGWRITLADALAARQKRGYDFERGYQCSIRLERSGAMLRIRPTCPVLCGSRKNFSALTVDIETGLCRYDE